MLNWILSSSVLILGIIGIRFLFQKKMKCKLQYALWLLVLIRLLVPFSIGHSSFSVSSTVNTISPIVMEQSQVSEQPRAEAPMEKPTVLPVGSAVHDPGMEKQPASPMVEAESISFREMLPKILSGIWITGSIVTGMTFLSANLTFRRRLKISRHRIPAYPCKLPVYVTNRIQSPCLFGLSHPAIYLTRQVMEDESMIRHTVAHEFTHYRHKDHVWAILRGVCLTIHWFNPLVWWAAILSQRDAELACDEDTIKVLGEGERKAYGMTLIHVSCQKNTNLLTAATTMTADKKVLKQRIQTIARKRKNVALAVIAVTFLAAAFVGCTFSGAEKATKEEEPLPGETTLQTETTEVLLESDKTTSMDFAYSDLVDYDFVGLYVRGYTRIHISPDGSFQGICDLGGEFSQEIYQKFPGGVRDYCDFSGRLANFTQENEYKITTTIASLQLGHEPGTEEIRGDVKYIYSAGQGMKAGDRIEIFLPGAPVAMLPDELMGDLSGFENFPGYALFNPDAGFAYGSLDLKAERKGQAMAAIQEAEAACRELETQRSENQNMSQADLNGISQLQYEAWDKALNTVWEILKETLSKEEMEKLTREQMQWIKEKEAAAEKAVVDAGGSSMAISAYGETAERWTRQRLEILVPLITGETISCTEEALPASFAEPVTFDGYTYTPEGDSVPVKLTMTVENVQEGEAAWKQILSQKAQLPEPEQGKEYIIVTVKVTYEDGELETLNFVENYPASLAAARVHFNVPNENSNTEDVTYNLANPIWGPDPFEGRFEYFT